MAPHATDDTVTSPSLESTSLERPKEPVTINHGGYRSLPVANPCLSYWHRTTRAFPYLNHNQDSPVPSQAKYLIIGSGLAGTLTAWSLIERGIPGNEILVLEAREAVSGASGRNAGHCRPDAFRGFAAYARVHGEEQAKKIVENEKLVFEQVDAFVKEHQVPCDLNSTTTFDVCLTEEFAAYEKDSLEKYRTAGGDVSHVKFFEGEEAKSRTKVDGAIAAYEWPAGSVHPAKLTQWMLSRLLDKGVQLFTHCPATEISKHHPGSDGLRWNIATPRGIVAAENVVHCTNAYCAHLLPELAKFVTPNRAQAHSFVPSASLSGEKALSSTMSLRYSLRQFFSFIQRLGDGTVVFGTSRENDTWSDDTKNSIVTFDDTAYNEEVASTAEQAFESLFDGGSKIKRHGEGADNYWSGIIAMTPDSVPMVGPLQGKEGQYICAGFNGHGMARIWTCAPGVVKLMLGESWSATGLPECFQYGTARLGRAAKHNIKGVW
ncbi:FAD dependent oxidoreductase [Lecanosticta acicola]|uniref:FAD dependent oxidoreductase n=1 Tax=Lecanosticta acicola TaxID=111012 RepID=A0AAI9EAX5_9PEZI|nr:FAD dependent oxidoreductase [Lecanosticta acicola]